MSSRYAKVSAALAALACGTAAGCGGDSPAPQAGTALPTASTASTASPASTGRGRSRFPPRRPSHRRATGSAYVGSSGSMHTSKAPPAAKARVLPPHTPQQRRSYAAVVATVQAVVAGIASHDPGICDRLFTLHYVESINGLKGTAALARCRRSIGAYRGAFKLVRIKQVQGDDRSAIVQFVTSMHAKRANVIFQLVHTGDGWKVHAALRRVK